MSKQRDQVVEVMRQNGGYATFGELYQRVDVSQWTSKTPFASIRRIVQETKYFFRIRPGLWALNECRDEVLHKFQLHHPDSPQAQDFSHSFYQGLLVSIGNMRGFQTYIPPQDKNRIFLEKPLCSLTTLPILPDFTYPDLLRFAKTVDVAWLNERKMPNSLFEVEHTTDFQNSLSKFYELQDFYIDFHIVADIARKSQFEDVLGRSIFREIQTRVRFLSYESLAQKYEQENELRFTR